MIILITIASILAIAGAVWLFNKFSPWYICPICAGVSGTWLWMLIGMSAGKLPITNYQLPIAILMGGSVVGIAYQVEKRLPIRQAGLLSGKPALLWKTLFIPAGLALVYGVLLQNWQLAGGAGALALLFLAAFLLPVRKNPPAVKNDKIKELEDKMKNCC